MQSRYAQDLTELPGTRSGGSYASRSQMLSDKIEVFETSNRVVVYDHWIGYVFLSSEENTFQHIGSHPRVTKSVGVTLNATWIFNAVRSTDADGID